MATSASFIAPNGKTVFKCTTHKRYRAKQRGKLPSCEVCKSVYEIVNPPICDKHPAYTGKSYPYSNYQQGSYKVCNTCNAFWQDKVNKQEAELDAKPRRNNVLVTIRKKSNKYMLSKYYFSRDDITGYRPNSRDFSRFINRWQDNTTKKVIKSAESQDLEVVVFRPTEVYPIEVLEDPKFEDVLMERGKNIQVLDMNVSQPITQLKQTEKVEEKK